jgi:hypothetical protein
MTDKDFIKEVFEIACGHGAICVPEDTGNTREFTKEEVLENLMEFSDNALKWEEQEPKVPEALDKEFMNWYNRGYENGLKEHHNILERGENA